VSRLCDRRHPRSGPDEAVDEVNELVIEGGTVGLELRRAVMVGLWVFLWWFAVVVCGGLRWWVCTLQWVSDFFFFFFFILRCFKHCKIFFRLFSGMQPNTGKKLFSLKSFTFANILRWKIIYSETKGTLNCSKVWRKIDF
jgi:hypothetical protein